MERGADRVDCSALASLDLDFRPQQERDALSYFGQPYSIPHRDNRQWLRAGFLSGSTYLVYPMAPGVVLYCHSAVSKFRALRKFADCVSPVDFTDGMVESENSGQVFMASRFLISSRPHFEAERAFAATIGTDTYAPHQAKRAGGQAPS